MIHSMNNRTDIDGEYPEPPPEIGPHAERELDLMLAGEKPLAYFSEPTRSPYELPDADFEPYVQSGQIIKRDFVETVKIAGSDEEIRYLYFALPGEEWRIEKAIPLTVFSNWVDPDLDQIERDLGKLLGYSEKEISIYLDWRKQNQRASNA